MALSVLGWVMSESVFTGSPLAAPAAQSKPVPSRVSVAVVGGGLSGLSVAQRLTRAGIDAHVFEARSSVGAGMATRGIGIASTLLLDPPHRLIAAVGEETASEILRFSAEGVNEWGAHLHPTGVAYATKGSEEAEEIPMNMAAMRRMGVPAASWSPKHAVELGDGWLCPSGGVIDLEAATAELAHSLSVSTSTRVMRVDDQGLDLALHCADGQVTLADVVIMTGGAQITGWAEDKFHPIRHQALSTSPAPPCIPIPLHIQYGYTSVRQNTDGTVMISGCRWATPHLEVGETDDTVIQPAVDARLMSFLHQHWPQLRDTPITHRWTGITTTTCDGLPVIGPLPGRPRIISCGGFGAFSPSLALRAAQAVVDGITTGESPGVPECFSTRRFD